jgi:hypothetical protein
MDIGDTFLFPTPPNGNHLFFAVALTADDKYLCFSVTTRDPGSDDACILVPAQGVPSFITRESAIVYKRAKEIHPNVYARLVSRGECIPQERCSPDIVKKIQLGALQSKKIAKKHRETIKRFLGEL